MESGKQADLDIAIIGGGIAGLWLLNRLLNAGYNAALFEAEGLGGYQTVASQGMIHGGIKYALQGKRTGASETIAEMPDYWRQCLRGAGDVDLRGTQVLSEHFYMWSTDNWWSRFMTFSASLAMRGRIEKVRRSQRPPLFQTPQFHGGLYRLVDMVLDVPSVVKTLADNASGRIFKLDSNSSQWSLDSDGKAQLLLNGEYTVNAKQFFLTAGKGNGDILQQLGLSKPAMQLRPLHQVMVKHNNPHSFYGHCVTSMQQTPRLTISSHPMADGSQVWYLGGTLAEEGVHQSDDTLIANAQHELQTLMPWLDLSQAEWRTLRVDRAEPAQLGGRRPDNFSIETSPNCNNLSVAWPTKLALAPSLANCVLRQLQEQGIEPTSSHQALLLGSPPPLAATPWELGFSQ